MEKQEYLSCYWSFFVGGNRNREKRRHKLMKGKVFLLSANQYRKCSLFYRNLWVMADLYEHLKYYEDLDEKGFVKKERD